MNGRMPGGWGVSEADTWFAENVPAMQQHVLFTFSSVPEPETRAFLQQKNLPSLVKPFEVADLIAQTRRLLPKANAASAS